MAQESDPAVYPGRALVFTKRYFDLSYFLFPPSETQLCDFRVFRARRRLGGLALAVGHYGVLENASFVLAWRRVVGHRGLVCRSNRDRLVGLFALSGRAGIIAVSKNQVGRRPKDHSKDRGTPVGSTRSVTLRGVAFDAPKYRSRCACLGQTPQPAGGQDLRSH